MNSQLSRNLRGMPMMFVASIGAVIFARATYIAHRESKLKRATISYGDNKP